MSNGRYSHHQNAGPTRDGWQHSCCGGALRFVAGFVALSLATAVASSAAAETRTVSSAAVYGADDRVDAQLAQSGAVLRVRDAMVAIVHSDRLRVEGGDVVYDAETLGETAGLCVEERFAEQPSLARCSGVLVAPDLVLTAGHCVPNAGTCASRSFVFGWDGLDAPPVLERQDVYACAEVVAADTRGARNLRLDYAWVRLDRAVSGRAPAQVADPSVRVFAGDTLVYLGYPGGIPLVADEHAVVSSDRLGARDYVELAVDAFEGGSGGPLMNADGAVVAVLVRGEADYVAQDDCNVTNQVVGAGGEEATLTEWPLRALCAAAPDALPCVECGAACQLCAALTGGECGEVPREWTCAEGVYDAGDGCDCGCGVVDPDCVPSARVIGCAPGQLCNGQGVCAEPTEVPDGWMCDPIAYDDAACDCACGVPDPACELVGVDCETAPKTRGCAVAGDGDRPALPAWPWLLFPTLALARRCRAFSARA